MPIKVGVADTHWVIYILVSNILAHLRMKKTTFNNLHVSLSIAVNLKFNGT